MPPELNGRQALHPTRSLKFSVIAIGKLKAEYARLGCAQFSQRLSRLFRVEHIEVKDIRRGRGGNVSKWKDEEARLIRGHIPRGALIVALDERGREWTSTEFAQWIDEQQNRSTSHIVFILGGPDGLQDELRRSAHRVWSLGRLTLPHEMARLLLFEQLYRAGSLLNGHPYHRE